MEKFFAYDYTGAPFVLFGTAHWIALGVVLLVGLGLTRFKGASEAARKKVRVTLALVLWLNESAWHIWNLAWGHWDARVLLPLNACSLLIWLSGFMLIYRNYAIYEFAYFMGIGGAFQYLLTPDLGLYGFPHFRFFQTFTSHGALLLAAVYMTAVEGFRPTWRSFWRVVIGTNLYAAVIFLFNVWLGSNYLVINGKPATPSMLDLMPPWPYYIIYIEAIGFLTFLILYLPFAIKDWMARCSAATG